MEPTADRRAEANRLNAQKSTGPKTAEGKARSRRNALRHGLAAEVLVAEQDKGAVASAVAEWNHEVWPENVAERAIIRRMAVADIRLQRCENATEDHLESSARAAVDRWRASKQKATRKRACALKTDPLNTLLDLEDSAFGCDWLIRRWSALERPLEQGIGWSEPEREAAMRLLGYVPTCPGPDGSVEARQMWRLGRIASDLEVEPLDDDQPNDPAAARSALLALIADRVEALEARASESWERVEGPEREAIIARSLAGDDGPESLLRHRYDRDAQNALFRSMTMLIRIRKRRDELDEQNRKRAKAEQIHRISVGGGWWRENNAKPCPPGFQPINRFAPAAPPETAPDPAPEPPRSAAPSPTPVVPVPSAPHPERSPGAPARNEPISAPESPDALPRNSFPEEGLRANPASAPPRRPERSRAVIQPLTDRPDRPPIPRCSPG